MENQNVNQCSQASFCCKDLCLEKCDKIKKDTESIKQTITGEKHISGSILTFINQECNSILDELNSVENDFENRHVDYDFNKEIKEKLERKKIDLENSKLEFELKRIASVILITLLQILLINCQSNLSILVWIFITALFFVQLIIVLGLCLDISRYNLINKKLSLLILKVELGLPYPLEAIERDLQLLMRLLDKNTFLF